MLSLTIAKHHWIGTINPLGWRRNSAKLSTVVPTIRYHAEGPLNSEPLPVPGISGKKFTVGMITTMIVVGGLLAYELAVYENLDRARANSAKIWRTVATQLDKDYKQIESLGPETFGSDTEWIAQFRHGADQFRTATTMEEQLRVGRTLETQLLNKKDLAKHIHPMSDSFRQEISDLNASLAAERRIQQSLAGRVVQFFIRHPLRELWENVR